MSDKLTSRNIIFEFHKWLKCKYWLPEFCYEWDCNWCSAWINLRELFHKYWGNYDGNEISIIKELNGSFVASKYISFISSLSIPSTLRLRKYYWYWYYRWVWILQNNAYFLLLIFSEYLEINLATLTKH